MAGLVQQFSRTTIFLGIVLLLVACNHQDSLGISKLSKLELNRIPATVAQMITEKNLPLDMMVAVVGNKNVKFFSDIPENYLKERKRPLIESIKRLKVEKRIGKGVYLISIHNGFDQKYPWPILSFSATSSLVASQDAILIPDFFALHGYHELFAQLDRKANKLPWEKKQSVIFWRGSTAGLGKYIDNGDWHQAPRIKFLDSATRYKNIDAGFSNYTPEVGKIGQYKFKQAYPLVNFVKPEHHTRYKYLVDMDGLTTSFSRMAMILYSNSLLMKHKSDQIQWYYSKLQDRVHYLLINEDFSNLQEQFDWAEANPEGAKQIATQSRELAREIFHPARLLDELAKSFETYRQLVS